MKNLQVIDILNSIIEGFNKQLIEANRNVYEGVDTNIRRNETFGVAPFNRREGENIWDIRVCVASNLTGDKFKTRRFTDYGNYINNTVYFQPIKGLDGTTIDFNQASTYSNIDGEDLETYVGLESEWLSRKIEGVFGAEGTFSTHQQAEYTRLYESFGEYYGDWQAGKALQGAGFYAKPMFPHGPNMLQTAAIAASMTGQVWIAVAVSAATSAIQMADGTMSWKQAAFQVGMSVATSALGAGAGKLGDMASVAAGGSKIIGAAATSSVSAVGNTLLSSVTLEGGHLGVDEDRLTSGRTWAGAGITAASGTIANGYMTSDISRAAVNGIGAGLSGGVSTGDWKSSMADGIRGAAAGYLAGKAGGTFTTATGLGSGSIINMANFGLQKLMGGDDKFTWDMAAQNNAVGDAIGGYLNNAFGPTPEETAAARRAKYQEVGFSEDEARELLRNENGLAGKQQRDFDKLGFMDRMDSAVGGMFLSMRDDMLNFNSDMSRAAGDIGSGLSYAANMAGDFAQSTGNLFKGDGFNTDEQVEQIKEQQKLEEIRRDQNLKENQKLVDAKYGESYKEAVPETDNSKAVQIIKDKLARGESVSDQEINDFFKSAEMKSVERAGKENGSALEKELMETIKNDPKAFEEAMKAKKLDPAKPEDVQAFSRQMQASFCVLFSEFAQMTLNNVNGAAPSIGEFYKDLLNGKSSNGGKLIDVLNQKVSTQEIFDSVAGKGNVKVYGYGQDRNGKGFSDGSSDTGNYDGYDMMSKIDELEGDKSIKFVTVRVNTGGNHYHDMTLKNGKDGFTLYDNSYRGKNLDYNKYSKFLNKNTIKSFYYIR